MFRAFSFLLMFGVLASAAAPNPATSTPPAPPAGSFDAQFNDWKSMFSRKRTFQ
jgi:hypothetical protein